jgi:hypothetical protein
MGITNNEFIELIEALDRALRQFESRPTERGFDLEIYNELRRVREILVRDRRDQHDPNLLKDRGSSGSA